MRLLIPSRTIHLLLTLILFILALHVQHDDAVVEATPGFWNYLFPTTIIPLPKFDGYKTKRLLGQGGFGKVYLVKSKDNGILLALKDVSASSHREELINPVKVIMHELIMTRLAQHHPYIIYPYTQNPVILSTHAYALFEYCDLGSLEDALEFPPKTQQAATLHHNVRQDAQCLFWEVSPKINELIVLVGLFIFFFFV